MWLLVEAAGRLVANRNVPGSGVTARYGTIDNTGRVEHSLDLIMNTDAGAATTTESAKTFIRKVKKRPMKKV